MKTITSPGVPVDEIGLLILARMYHLKLCILLKHHYWCTLNGSDVEQSEIVIAFHGKLKFSDTRSRSEKLRMEQYHLQQRSSLDILECPACKSPSKVPEPPMPLPAPIDPEDKPSTPPVYTRTLQARAYTRTIWAATAHTRAH